MNINDLKWLAEKRGTGIQSSNPNSQAVPQDIHTLCREPCQNSNDQIDDKDKPVKIKYSIITLTGDFKKRFLEALKWKDLRKHLKAVTEIENIAGNSIQKIKKGFKSIESNSELTLLRIEDFNTKAVSYTHLTLPTTPYV